MADLAYPAHTSDAASEANFQEILKKWPSRLEVTSLPTDPFDGQEVDLVVDSLGTYGGPYLWHCKYRAATTAPYRWHVFGGEALWAYVGPSQTRSLGSYGDLATVGPSITVPFAGIYSPRLAMDVFTNASNAFGAADLQIGATLADGSERLLFQQLPYAGGASNAAGREQIPIVVAAAGAVVKMVYQADGVNAATFSSRSLALRPVRIG
jgi:hypothetical protein